MLSCSCRARDAHDVARDSSETRSHPQSLARLHMHRPAERSRARDVEACCNSRCASRQWRSNDREVAESITLDVRSPSRNPSALRTLRADGVGSTSARLRKVVIIAASYVCATMGCAISGTCCSVQGPARTPRCVPRRCLTPGRQPGFPVWSVCHRAAALLESMPHGAIESPEGTVKIW